jgi:acyl-coenzyme A synthetase/AMP-(fatty) acid ligase
VVLVQSQSSRPVEAAKEIFQHVKKETARHKWLEEIEIVAAIPKSPAGKILRRKLQGGANGDNGNTIVKDTRFTAKI